MQQHGVGRASDASARARRLHTKEDKRPVDARVHGRQAGGEGESGGGLEEELELLRQQLAGEMLAAPAPAPAPAPCKPQTSPSDSLHARVDTRRQLPRTTHCHITTTTSATTIPRRPASAICATTRQNTDAARPYVGDGGRRREAEVGHLTRACSAGASDERHNNARARVELDRWECKGHTSRDANGAKKHAGR